MNSIGNNLMNDIVAACESTSDFLRGYFQADISVCIPRSDVLDQIADQWGRNPFDWSWLAFNDRESFCSFRLALLFDQKVCGLVANCYEKETNYNTLVIEKIQGHPDKSHPLKGMVVAAFSAANLEIAKRLNIGRLYVEQPVEETLPLYAKLGYRTGYFMAGGVHEAELYVFDDSKITLPALSR